MNQVKHDDIRQAVRQKYGQVAESEGCGCGPACCGGTTVGADILSQALGYSADETALVPEGANMGLGCGNPQAIANLKAGETVLDLGSGGGFDCFLAARQAGDSGHVIGVDMTPAMVSKARANAEKGGYRNTEFRLGEIECVFRTKTATVPAGKRPLFRSVNGRRSDWKTATIPVKTASTN